MLSTHSIFSTATVNLIKAYVLEKFPSEEKIKYDDIRQQGYLKANENQSSSARTDPESCTKGNYILNYIFLFFMILYTS